MNISTNDLMKRMLHNRYEPQSKVRVPYKPIIMRTVHQLIVDCNYHQALVLLPYALQGKLRRTSFFWDCMLVIMRRINISADHRFHIGANAVASNCMYLHVATLDMMTDLLLMGEVGKADKLYDDYWMKQGYQEDSKRLSPQIQHIRYCIEGYHAIILYHQAVTAAGPHERRKLWPNVGNYFSRVVKKAKKVDIFFKLYIKYLVDDGTEESLVKAQQLLDAAVRKHRNPDVLEMQRDFHKQCEHKVVLIERSVRLHNLVQLVEVGVSVEHYYDYLAAMKVKEESGGEYSTADEHLTGVRLGLYLLDLPINRYSAVLWERVGELLVEVLEELPASSCEEVRQMLSCRVWWESVYFTSLSSLHTHTHHLTQQWRELTPGEKLTLIYYYTLLCSYINKESQFIKKAVKHLHKHHYPQHKIKLLTQ